MEDIFKWSCELEQSVERLYYCSSMIKQHIEFFEENDSTNIKNQKDFRYFKDKIERIEKDYLHSNPNYIGHNIMNYDEYHNKIYKLYLLHKKISKKN